jgi:hypothetical protein
MKDIEQRLAALAEAVERPDDAQEATDAATIEETKVFLTAVMRGTLRDSTGLRPSISARIRAASLLIDHYLIVDPPGVEAEDPLTKSLREEACRIEQANKARKGKQ